MSLILRELFNELRYYNSNSVSLGYRKVQRQVTVGELLQACKAVDIVAQRKVKACVEYFTVRCRMCYCSCMLN